MSASSPKQLLFGGAVNHNFEPRTDTLKKRSLIYLNEI